MQNRERCLGGFFLSADIPVELQESSDFSNNWKPREGKILKSWVLSLTQKGKGKPQQGIFCCFKYAHCIYLGRTPVMCFLLCLFVQHIALLSTGICSQLLERTLKAQHFHRDMAQTHSCPSQAA